MTPLLLWLLAARAQDPVLPWLVPTPNELADSLSRAERLLEQGRALHTATARVQNALLPRLRGKPLPCEDEGSQLALRAERLGDAWWARLQSARAELERARRMAENPTARPLLREEDDARLAHAEEEARRQAASYLLARSVHEQSILPYQARCPAALAPGPGLPAAAPQAADERREGIAVLVLQGGLVCPDPARGEPPVAVAESGEAVVLATAQGCFTTGDCDCTQRRILPGAVLGP